MPFPSSLFKAKARQVLRNHWQTALLIALIVNLPSLLVQAVSSFSGTDPVERAEALLIVASRDGLMTQQYLTDQLQAILQDTGASAPSRSPCRPCATAKKISTCCSGSLPPIFRRSTTWAR